MKDWMDFNDDQLENDEVMFAKENLYINNEEHKVLFGDTGLIDDEEEKDYEMDLLGAGIDANDLEDMDPDERAEALEDAELDIDDYDMDY